MKKYDYIYLIPSYNRYEMLLVLINNINYLHKKDVIKIIIINDGSNDARYTSLKEVPNIDYLQNDTNNGRKLYWKTVNKLFGVLSKYTYKYTIMLSDDMLLIDNYYTRLNDGLKLLKEKTILRIFTQNNITSNWGYNNWVDGAFCCQPDFFNTFKYKLTHVTVGIVGSSGVGKNMTNLLNKNTFSVIKHSLLKHNGNLNSVMFPHHKNRNLNDATTSDIPINTVKKKITLEESLVLRKIAVARKNNNKSWGITQNRR